MARRGISVRPWNNITIDTTCTTIVEFFDWNTGQSGKIEFYSTPNKNLAVTMYGHTERVTLEEARPQDNGLRRVRT